MRWSLGLLAPALACLAHAESGVLYIYDSPSHAPAPASSSSSSFSPSSHSTTVGPETARLILASRLALDHFHSLGHVDQTTIQAINDLSADQHLFTSSEDRPVALILGQGIAQKDVPVDTASHHVQTVDIANMPSASNAADLVVDLASQSGLHKTKQSLVQLQDDFFASPSGPVFRIAKDATDFTHHLNTLLRQDYTVLALTVPNDTTSKHSFGTYSMPSPKHSDQHHKRQLRSEKPLITDTPSTYTSDSILTPAAKDSSNTTPLKGILPQCFSSLSACQSLTRNCTGHGSCTLKYTDKDSRPEAPCYSCACSADVRTNADGTKKTTQWGGPACQKKDVSMPFWLLAGFTVLLVSLISFGVGQLITMGNEELPSVIGAGVSGVTRTK